MFLLFLAFGFCFVYCTSVSDDSWISYFIMYSRRKIFWSHQGIFIFLIWNFCEDWDSKSQWNDNSFPLNIRTMYPPAIAGMNLDVITSSSWFSWSEMSGVVLMMYDGLCVNAVLKQEYATWGFAFAIIDKSLISFMSLSVLFWTYSRFYLEELMTTPRWRWPSVVILIAVSLRTVNARCLAFSSSINHDFDASE